MKHGDKTTKLLTLNRVHKMELNYIKEHTSCVNYKTEEDAGFALKEAALGEHFDNRQQEIKANHLIFILSGEVSITKDSKEETRVRAGEFIFIPLSSHYTGTVIQPGTYISLSFFHDTISLCDKHMLSSYLDKAQHTPLCFEPLSVRAPLDMFLHLLESYLQAGVNCKHLHELKERELFIIFRTAYTKSEIIQLLYPIMGVEVDFKAAVLQHKDRVRSKQELAELLGMSGSELHRKFTQEFGETVQSWLQKQKNKEILSRLNYDFISIKEVAYELGFGSAAGFNKYCKNNFGCSPSELRQEIKKKQQK
jgi:AraC-like DNA-binding protein/mannose-6-phosphate isomerase-like protein (cupin superfamily)